MKKYRCIAGIDFFGNCVYYIRRRVLYIFWVHVRTAYGKEERDKFLKHLSDD
jgi:hypothetical protein